VKQEKHLFWVWLADRLGAENHDFAWLINSYDPFDLFHMDEDELERIDCVSQRTINALSNKDLGRAGQILDDCTSLGITVISYDDPTYPSSLRGLRCPPVVLYCKGSLPDMSRQLCIGTVGTRRMSRYGMRVAYQLSYQLASVGAVVVSGMASGIDGVCAAGAIAAGGKTVAVVGAGIDVVYPKHHKPLMEEICRHGAVISEYPPKTPARGYQFPVRNRIISGLSQATVVVEAGISSGSLITAKDAILQGRAVYAFPSNVGNKGSEGTNQLLRDGVFLALSAADVLEQYTDSFSSVLHPERMCEPPEITNAVLEELDRLGVIELTTPEAYRCAESVSVTLPKSKREKKSEPAPDAEGAEARAKKRKREADGADAPTQATTTPQKTPDEVLSSLSDIQREVLLAMPDDRSVSLDDLRGCGKSIGEVVAALTMLELLGLVEKLPGGLYTKS
jgi:DNA processing protein